MTFEQYLTMMTKRWQLIAICFVVVGLGTFVVSKLMAPQYQSTAIVQIDIRSGSSPSDYNNLLASDQLVQTEAQLATSDSVLRAVASHYPGWTEDRLSKEVSSTPNLNTQLFEIAVVDTDPQQAARLANDIASTLIKQQLQLDQQDNQASQQQIQQDLATTHDKIATVSNQIAALQRNAGNQGQIVVLQSQLDSLQQHYSQWQTLLAQLELAEAQSGNSMRVVQPAQPGILPVQPKVLLNTGVGLLVGLLLGMLLAVLFEELDTHVRSSEALSAMLGWPVVGTVWRSRSSDKQETVNPQGHDANVESYRILRTNVGFAGIDKPMRTLMVTSSMPGDGKSTVAANLAIYMAKAGKNTLLVDADLRRPTIHQIFKLSPEKMGLSNAILQVGIPSGGASTHYSQFMVPASPGSSPGTSSSINLEQFIHQVGIPNLRVMPSGPLPPNPSEMLDSKSMQRLIEALQTCGADMIIFDTPPIRGLSDASILASKLDGTLLVVDVMRSNKNHLKQVKVLLTQAGANVLGCVINKQRRDRHDTSYSYYYYYRQHDDSASESSSSKQNGHFTDESTHMLTAASVHPAHASRKGGHSNHGH